MSETNQSVVISKPVYRNQLHQEFCTLLSYDYAKTKIQNTQVFSFSSSIPKKSTHFLFCVFSSSWTIINSTIDLIADHVAYIWFCICYYNNLLMNYSNSHDIVYNVNPSINEYEKFMRAIQVKNGHGLWTIDLAYVLRYYHVKYIHFLFMNI